MILIQGVRRVGGRMRRTLRMAIARIAAPALGPVERRANERWRSRVIESAQVHIPVSDVLVVAPHPDDETIGCAAFIMRSRARGARVRIIVVSDGGNSHQSALITESELGDRRREESRAAADVLGVGRDNVMFLGFESQALRARPDLVVDALASEILRFEPSEVLTTSIDEWSDEHRIVADYVRQAAARSSFAGALREFPVWHWDNGPSHAKPWMTMRRIRDLVRTRPLSLRESSAIAVPVAELRDRKEAAFACYRSQTTSLTGESSWRPFPDRWLEKFLDNEIFFTVTDGSGKSRTE